GGRGSDTMGASQRVVDEVHGLVGAHRQGLADRFGGALWTHRQDRHLAAVGLRLPQSLLDRELVKLVDHGVGRVAVERGVRLPQRALRPRVGDLLYADDNVHDRQLTSLSVLGRAGRFVPVASNPGGATRAKGASWPHFGAWPDHRAYVTR